MLTLHKPDTIFSLRHSPSWFMLACSAGAVNAAALLDCQRFVTHVTGTVTRLGVEISRVTVMLDFAIVLVCFILGAMVAGLLINGRAHRGKAPYFALPLWITSLAIGSIGILGQLGWFGPFGASVDEPPAFALLSILSFAMGLQNAAVATSTGLLVRTTHLTGPATDLGIHVAELLTARGDTLRIAKRHASLRAGKIAAFATGAIVATPLATKYGYLVFFVPAALTVVATLLSFVPASRRDDPPVPFPNRSG